MEFPARHGEVRLRGLQALSESLKRDFTLISRELIPVRRTLYTFRVGICRPAAELMRRDGPSVSVGRNRGLSAYAPGIKRPDVGRADAVPGYRAIGGGALARASAPRR